MTERSVDKKTEVLRTEEALKPCEYCGHPLPQGVDKRTRQVRSHHFASCKVRLEQKALAQSRSDEEQPAQQQEPVAWVNQANLNSASIQRNRGGQGDTHTWSETPTWDHSVPLYTSPPASKPWVELTELEALGAYEAEQQGRWGDHVRGLLAVEAKLREKNT